MAKGFNAGPVVKELAIYAGLTTLMLGIIGHVVHAHDLATNPMFTDDIKDLGEAPAADAKPEDIAAYNDKALALDAKVDELSVWHYNNITGWEYAAAATAPLYAVVFGIRRYVK